MKESWTKYITPVLVTIAIFMLGNIMAQVGRVDDKLFHHLANDEIHMPRSLYVSKAEFDLQSRFIEKENDRIIKAIDDLRNDLKAEYGKGKARN
ncbi:secreted protein [Candidatus Omnitrophus magneticus]|jgi:hypothetical protein|uniref:Secreted protein n=1 Tax=Candidatus Omnitrophus magneticus TaxID=1609969 RepID=A0A0F0CPN3_9BACT|nr:secreted protein [Candidatus Omnitrophus magneticus]